MQRVQRNDYGNKPAEPMKTLECFDIIVLPGFSVNLPILYTFDNLQLFGVT